MGFDRATCRRSRLDTFAIIVDKGRSFPYQGVLPNDKSEHVATIPKILRQSPDQIKVTTDKKRFLSVSL